MRYYCCDERRREVVKLLGSLNGIDYLEVHDSGVAGDPLRQRTLFVKLLRAVPALTVDNLSIDGGERIGSVDIEWISVADNLPASEAPSLVAGLSPLNEFLVVRTRYYGDFSTYTLHLLSGPGAATPPAGFDPRLSSVGFSFKVQCPSDFDCAQPVPCPPAPLTSPRLDYLAKDYASFRRLMLDRLSVLLPQWRDRNAADLAVTLIETLAYVGDHLSYQQDAVATEAYLGTARRRVSLRRHARLVDYVVHEGCNARVWAQVTVTADGVLMPRGTPFLTRLANTAERLAPGSDALRDALALGPQVFETMEDTRFYQAHARLPFYTWGERQCCLPKGATAATLDGEFANLKAGDVLVLVEELGPRTGLAEDADRTHRHAVRLTHVVRTTDPSGGLFLPVPNNNPAPVTEIYWESADALPFPLCISAITDDDHGATYLPSVSAARGNIVLADHGLTVAGEDLGVVPEARLTAPPAREALSCDRAELVAHAPRFHPQLAERPLTQRLDVTRARRFAIATTPAILADLQARLYSAAVQGALQGQGVVLDHGPVSVQGGDGCWSVSDGVDAYRLELESGELQVYAHGQAAADVTAVMPHAARPAITVAGTYQTLTDTWFPRIDLLASDREANEFVVETEHDGTAQLRFGDDQHGKRPNSGTVFSATYRVGNGTAGNIGLESLAHLVSNEARFARVSNPLPARGGAEPENADDVRRDAPEAFRIQERAVTQADYAEVTERHASVQRAAATFRWTGSWHTVFLTVDRLGGADIDADYERTIAAHVERYRMAGYDLEVNKPQFVALEIEMKVCVEPDYFRGDVRSALTHIFSNGWRTSGRPALFHPDNFSFGQPVYLSTLYAAAEEVSGVASVVIEKFQRMRIADPIPLEEGVLPMGRLEIARLDNDANFPERGVLRLKVGGGK